MQRNPYDDFSDLATPPTESSAPAASKNPYDAFSSPYDPSKEGDVFDLLLSGLPASVERGVRGTLASKDVISGDIGLTDPDEAAMSVAMNRQRIEQIQPPADVQRAMQAITESTQNLPMEPTDPTEGALSTARLGTMAPAIPTKEREAGFTSMVPAFFESVAKNPEAIPSMAGESLGAFAPALIAGAGAPSKAAMTVVTGLGSLGIEYGSTLLESMTEAGIDVSNDQQVIDGLNNPELMSRARIAGLKRGIPVAAMDALSAGVAGKFVSRATTPASHLGRGTAELGVQSSLGMAGEAGGQLAESGKITSPSDVLLEGILEVPTGAAEIAVGTLKENAAAKADQDALKEFEAILNGEPAAPPPAPPPPVPTPATTPPQDAEADELDAVINTKEPVPDIVARYATPTEDTGEQFAPVSLAALDEEVTLPDAEVTPDGNTPPPLPNTPPTTPTTTPVVPDQITPATPARVETDDDLLLASTAAASSPFNDRAEPTEAQKKAGNYKKSHIKVQGLDVSIETPRGGIRAGKDANGNPWQVQMEADYGYIKRTTGADGDQLDVYVGPAPTAPTVYVIDQVHSDSKKFDEHKGMIGFPSRAAALETYRRAFSDGRGAERIGAVTEMTVAQFRKWARNGDLKKPVGTLPSPSVKQIEDQAAVFDAGEFKKNRYPDYTPAKKQLLPYIREIVRQVMESSGGSLYFKEADGQGSTPDIMTITGSTPAWFKTSGYTRKEMERVLKKIEALAPLGKREADIAYTLYTLAQEMREKNAKDIVDFRQERGSQTVMRRAEELGINTAGREAQDILFDIQEREAIMAEGSQEEETRISDAHELATEETLTPEEWDEFLAAGLINEEVSFDTYERDIAGEAGQEPEARGETGTDGGESTDSSGSGAVAETGTGAEERGEGAPEGGEAVATDNALSASQQDYETMLWNAANDKLDKGGTVTVTTQLRSWSITKKTRDALRLRNGKIEMMTGGKWVRLGPYGQPIDTFARSVGMPDTFARSAYKAEHTPSSEEDATLTDEQIIFGIANTLGTSEEDAVASLSSENLKKVVDAEDEAYKQQVYNFLRASRPDLFQPTERTEAGEQAIIPGAERISDKTLAERKMDESLRAKKPQKDAGSDGGLFDTGARQQTDIFDSAPQKKISAQEQVENEAAQPVLGLDKRSTGWKKLDRENGVILIDPRSNKRIPFIATDNRSGTALARARAEAQAYAIDNPITQEPLPVSGELEVRPLFNQADRGFSEGMKFANPTSATLWLKKNGVQFKAGEKATLGTYTLSDGNTVQLKKPSYERSINPLGSNDSLILVAANKPSIEKFPEGLTANVVEDDEGRQFYIELLDKNGKQHYYISVFKDDREHAVIDYVENKTREYSGAAPALYILAAKKAESYLGKRLKTGGSEYAQRVADKLSAAGYLDAGRLIRTSPKPSEPKPAEQAKPEKLPAENSLQRDSSWVIKNKETGEIVMETFDKKKVDALNTEKYEAVPILEHLGSLNKKPEKQDKTAESAAYSFAEHTKVKKALTDGEYTAAQVKQLFDRAADSRQAMLEEMRKLTKEEITNRYGVRAGAYGRSATKDWLMKQAFDQVLSDFYYGESFSWSPMQETMQAAYDRLISAQTDEDIKAGVARRDAATSAYKEKVETVKRALTDPQTLDDFRLFVRDNGIEKLTDEQLKRYDALSSAAALERRKEDKARAATVKGVETPDGIEAAIIPTKHTQKGHDLFVVSLSDRVEKDVYNALNATAKRLGGYYSSYRAGGAVPGFQFTTREAAENFVAASKGETVTAERGRKPETRAEKLRAAGDRLIAAGEESLNQDRKVNTHRRATMAAGAEANAQAEIAMGKTLRAIADRIESGTASVLEGINARTEIETLHGLMRQAMLKTDRGLSYDEREKRKGRRFSDEDARNIEYPYPSFHVDNIPNIAGQIGGKPGFKLLGQHLLKLHKEAVKAKESLVKVRDPKYIAKVKEAAERYEHTMGWLAEGGVADYMRLQRLGITNLPLMRQAVREYAEIMADKPKANPIKEAERALVGKKWDGYFPTPPALAERMADELDVSADHTVLEPSAGKGSLIDAAVAAGADPKNIDALEIVTDLQNILKLKGYNVVGRNFLEHEGSYDRIIMNPPFENGQDMDHVRHAYGMLNEGGKVVAIMSEGPFFRSDKKATEFRDWLDSIGGTSEKLPEGSFKDSDRSTGVATRLVIIQKPPASGKSKPDIIVPAKGRRIWPVREATPDDHPVVGIKNRLAKYLNSLSDAEYSTLEREAAVQPKVVAVFSDTAERADRLIEEWNTALGKNITKSRRDGGGKAVPPVQRLRYVPVAKWTEAKKSVAREVKRIAAERFGAEVNVDYVDSIIDPEGFFTTGTYTQKSVNNALESFIAVAIGEGSKPFSSINHEGVHHLRSMGALDKVWGDLVRMAESKWIERYQIEKQYPNNGSLTPPQLRDLHIEEAIAEAFADYATGKDGGMPTRVQRVFQRMQQFFESIRSYLAGRGFRTWRDVFEEVAGGKYASTGRTIQNRQRDDLAQRSFFRQPEDENGEVDFSLPEEGVFDVFQDNNRTVIEKLMAAANRRAVQKTILQARFRIQDQFAPMRKVQENIEKATGQKITEDENVAMVEEMYSGRTGEKLRKLHKAHFEKIYNDLAKLNRTITDRKIEGGDSIMRADQFAYARHAPERNAYIKKLYNDKVRELAGGDEKKFADIIKANGFKFADMPEDLLRKAQAGEPGSGMSDQEAADIIQQAKDDGIYDDLMEITDAVRKILDIAATERVRMGLTSDTVDAAQRKTYQTYFPLRGHSELEVDNERPKTGRGYNITGQESKRAKGRKSKATNLISNSLSIAEEAIVRGEKNRVWMSLYNLAVKFPNSKMWTVRKDNKVLRVNPDTGVQEWVFEKQEGRKLDDYTVSGKIKGEQYSITLTDKRLATAMKNLDVEQFSLVWRMFARFSQIFSMNNTMFSPEFVISNPIRDIQGGLITAVSHKEGLSKGIRKEYRRALNTVWRGLRDDESAPGLFSQKVFGFKDEAEAAEYMKYYKEYRSTGGAVSFWKIEDVREHIASLAKEVGIRGEGVMPATKRSIRATIEMVETINTAADNGIRLAAYVASRKLGATKQEAAVISKNITVNFNKRGTHSRYLNAMYPFFNAGLQGTAVIVGAARRSKKVRAIMGGLVLSGIMMDMLTSALSPDDDDGESIYDKIPEWEKESNYIIIFPDGKLTDAIKKSIPWKTKNGIEYGKIPLVYGYRVFYAIGRNIAATLRGAQSGWDAAVNIAATITNNYSPIGSGEFPESLMPTVLEPFLNISRNKDAFTGRPIMPHVSPYDAAPPPDSQRYFPNVSSISKAITGGLNSLTGGDEVQPGFIDVSPESLDYLFAFFTGAAGAFVGRTIDMVPALFSEKPMAINDIVLARKLFGSTTPWGDKTLAYERIKEIKELAAIRKKYDDLGQYDKAEEFDSEHRALLELYGTGRKGKSQTKDTADDLAAMSQERRFVMADEKLSDEERQERLDAIDADEQALVNEFNMEYNKAMKHLGGDTRPFVEKPEAKR